MELLTWLNLNGNTPDCSEMDDPGKLTMAVRQEDFYKTARFGPKRLRDRMNAKQQGTLTASIGCFRPGGLQG